MIAKLPIRIALIVAGGAVALVAGCAAGPAMDGGIVGTGSRPDCEVRTTKDGSRLPLPPECESRDAAPR